MKEVRASQLAPDMVLLFPFGKSATVTAVKVGRVYVTVDYVDATGKGQFRQQLADWVLIDDQSAMSVEIKAEGTAQ